jgi:hypothetical protein
MGASSRRAWASQDLDWFVDLPNWECLRSIVLIESERTVGAETSIERRYYWSSHRVDAETFSESDSLPLGHRESIALVPPVSGRRVSRR